MTEDETLTTLQQKLQPFFPPLEQLQSLNLRAALFRCLDNAKKTGVLGRDTVLRKTMLDECKGERLEEVLAVFSNAVLKKVLAGDKEVDRSIAKELALENFSYHGERSVLSSLILAHKASLSASLRSKDHARAKVKDFEELLSLEERRITRRSEQLKEIINEQDIQEKLSGREVNEVQNTVHSSWSGNGRWLEEILYGSSRARDEGLLGTNFDKVWKHVEAGRIGDLEARSHKGLVDQLDTRVKDQEDRLARWQAYGRKLEKSGPVSPVKKPASSATAQLGFDLGFNKHQALQLAHKEVQHSQVAESKVEEYNKLIENMKNELLAIGKPKQTQHGLPEDCDISERSPSPIATLAEQQAPVIEDDEGDWSSESEAPDAEIRPSGTNHKPILPIPTPSRTPSPEPSKVEHKEIAFKKPMLPRQISAPKKVQTLETAAVPRQRAVSPLPIDQVEPPSPPQRTPKLTPPINEEANLADAILNSMAAASPSPKKRHTLSLAERTRLSMSRNNHSKFSDLHDEYEVPDISRLSIRTRPSPNIKSPTEEEGEAAEKEKHADLIERTRKSMAGFEAAQKKAQLDRRRSVKDEKRKQRQSSYFPKVEEEGGDGVKKEEIIRDPDYDSVFMSRPKMAMSPTLGPERIWEDDEDVME